MQGAHHQMQRGATLIETLITIGLIGVVFSLAFPALMQVRTAGGRTKSLANARSAATAIHSHSQRHNDRYPILQAHIHYPGAPSSAGGFVFNDELAARWATRDRWWAVIASDDAIIEEWEAWFSPGVDASKSLPSYYFSNSFVAAPRLWTPGFDGDSDVLRPVRLSEVARPAGKAMLWDGVLAYQHPSALPAEGPLHWLVPIAFADLHADVKRFIDAAAPVPNQLNNEAWRDSALHNTLRGVNGADY